MKIRLLEEATDREVELVGKVLCTRSDEYDMSWEFQKGTEYDLYKQTFEDGTELYNLMSDKYFDFVLR
jgi:hypothetical protein